MPWRDIARTSMLGPLRLTMTRALGACSAVILTAFLPQDEIVISPPKLFTPRRAPGRTSNVVSVRTALTVVRRAVASTSNIESVLLALADGHQVGRALQQPHLALQLLSQVSVQIRVRRIGHQRAARIADRPIDERQVLLDDPHRRGIELRAMLLDHILQLVDRGIVTLEIVARELQLGGRGARRHGSGG